MPGRALSTTVTPLDVERAAEVVEVIAEAFHGYPVMRFVLAPGEGEYDARLRTLIRLFVMSRFAREEPVLGIETADGLLAGALASRPHHASPPALDELRAATWDELGPAARERYAVFSAACAPFQIDEGHVHLNMVGVAGRARGQGFGRALIDHVQSLSRADPDSVGVTLTTEDPGNVPLYEHMGYRIVGQAVVAPELRTWGFFRPD